MQTKAFLPFWRNRCIPNTLLVQASLLLLSALPSSVYAQPSGITSGKVIKWDQSPALAHPTNVFFGWNEESVVGSQVAADDWVCTTTNPVMKIRWWGSFDNWNSSSLPSNLPPRFRIDFWTDHPKGPTNIFSHPEAVVWEIICTNYTVNCVGKDYDPRMGTFETCFLFETTLAPQDWFFQNPGNGTNVYWLSIAADYPVGVPTNNLFGWKTRPRNPASPAPDAAVYIVNPASPFPGAVYSSGFPIVWAAQTNDWDLAFELLTTNSGTTTVKWEELPDLTTNGMDVNATSDSQAGTTPPYLLASDFLCMQSGFITNITIWGSWSNDILPMNNLGQPDPTAVQFTLSIHADIPATNGNYSRPGPTLWTATFGPGQFTYSPLATGITEGWLTPPSNGVFPGDHICHQYQFSLPTPGADPFFQQGSAANPIVYWLDLQAQLVTSQPTQPRPVFGWKSSVTNWNDDSTWAIAIDNIPGPPATAWNELRFPPGHPRLGQSIDLAFRLNPAVTQGADVLKWTQPPVIATNASNWFNGWNEPSIDGGGIWVNTPLTNIVADDWLCTNARPVTDLHWWGSFLTWTGNALPPQSPVAYHFAIWTDVPTNANNTFSHPGQVLWTFTAANTDPNLKINWVGWDIDPRTPCLDIESCFKFDYAIPGTNNWFYQAPGTNIYWLSISAVYSPATGVGLYPFGWKTRPHVPVPPDDAVRIFEPLVPNMGLPFASGQPIEFPTGTSWDMAFQLTTCQQHPLSNVMFTNITVTNVALNQITTLRWNSETNIVYVIQEATNLVAPITWTDVGPPILGPANTLTLTNPANIVPPFRFYRVKVPDICP